MNPIKTSDRLPTTTDCDTGGYLLLFVIGRRIWVSGHIDNIKVNVNMYSHWLPMPLPPKDECQLAWEESGLAGLSIPEEAIWISAWRAARKEKP